MCEAGRGRRYVGNARGNRLEGETLEGLLSRLVVADWNAASAAMPVSRDGTRGR